MFFNNPITYIDHNNHHILRSIINEVEKQYKNYIVEFFSSDNGEFKRSINIKIKEDGSFYFRYTIPNILTKYEIYTFEDFIKIPYNSEYMTNSTPDESIIHFNEKLKNNINTIILNLSLKEKISKIID